MTKDYEKIEIALTIIGGIIAAISAVCFMSSHKLGTGVIVICAIVATIGCMGVVLGGMESTDNTSMSVFIGIIIDVFMPVIAIIAVYALLFIYGVAKFFAKIISIFGFKNTIFLIIAIPVAGFFWLLYELTK